jgi:hypothetical protein
MIKVHEFLSDRDKWTQGTCARGPYNNYVDPSDQNACKFCVLGVLYKFYGPKPPTHILERYAYIFGNEYNDPLTTITKFNDNHTYEEIMERLRKADA